jgi:membrane protease YdiL (CAAX protease family)
MQAVEAHALVARALRAAREVPASPPLAKPGAERSGAPDDPRASCIPRSGAPLRCARGLAAFLAIAFAFTWTCWLSTAWIAPGRWHWLLSTAGQFGPFLAAVVVTARESGRAGLRDFLKRIVKWRVHPGWLAVALLVPPGTYYAAIGAKAFITGEAPALEPYRLTYDVFANFFIILFIGGPLGEEPGWRGYALAPLRALCGPTAGTIVLGVIWALWHLPLWWRAGEFPVGIIALVTLGMIAISFVFTSLYDRTGGSVLACVLLHTSLNTFFILLPMEWCYTWWVGVACVMAAGILWMDARRPAAW